MNTDREWMYRRYRDGSLTTEFLNGLESFMAFACTQHSYMNGEDIKCLCSKCKNKPFRPPHIVRLHLVKNGFVPKYYHWWVHGEQESPEVLGMSLRAEIRTNPFETMVLDVGGPSLKSKERIEESPTNGPGTGPVIHHGGSQKAPLHALDLEEAQRRLAEEISCYSINNASLPGTTEERIVITEREKDIHKEVAKVDRKSRVIGLGCLSQLYVWHESRGDICSSSSMMTQSDAHIRELEARLMAMEEEQTWREEEQARMAEEKARKDAAIDVEMQEMRDQMALFSSYVKTVYPGFEGFNS